MSTCYLTTSLQAVTERIHFGFLAVPNQTLQAIFRNQEEDCDRIIIPKKGKRERETMGEYLLFFYMSFSFVYIFKEISFITQIQKMKQEKKITSLPLQLFLYISSHSLIYVYVVALTTILHVNNYYACRVVFCFFHSFSNVDFLMMLHIFFP